MKLQSKFTKLGIFLAMFIAFGITTIVYLKFEIDLLSDNRFFDADSGRSLNYLSDPATAISSIRPGLWLLVLIILPLKVFFNPIEIWTLLNCIVLVLIVLILNFYGRFNRIYFYFVCFVFSTYFLHVWVRIPDTFLAAAGLYFATYIFCIYRNLDNRSFLSALVSCCLNIFLFIPWSINYFWSRSVNMRDFLRYCRISLGILCVILITQYGKNRIMVSPYLGDSPAIAFESRLREYLPFYDVSGLIGKLDFFGWIHSPLPGLLDNFKSYLTSPWTSGYVYRSDTIAIDSSAQSLIVVGIALSISLISFIGIFMLRKIDYQRFIFMLSLELSIFALYLVYSIHPFLFSPFLLLSRLTGVLVFINRLKGTIPVVLTLNVVLSCLLVFNNEQVLDAFSP